MSRYVAHLLLRLRWPLLGLGAALAIVCYLPAQRLDFDRSVENMFAPGDPLLVPYSRLKRTFGGTEVVLAVYQDPDLLAEDRSGIDRLRTISTQLEQTPGVRGVLSLAELDEAIQQMAPAAGLFGLGTIPERGIVDRQSELSQRFLQLFEGYTHGADGRTAAVVCMLEPIETAGAPRQVTVDQLREQIERLAGGQVTGEPVMVVDGFRYIEEDAQRLNWAVTLLLSATILLYFRSVRWVLVAAGVVQLSLLLTRATLYFSGVRLSMVSSMLTAVVTVVGIATVVHVIVRFREGRRQGLEPRDAFVRMAQMLAVPVFWACTTDAVGFAALLVAEVGPVRDFGLMMALGAMMVLVSVVLLVPGLTMVGRHPAEPRVRGAERLLARGLGGSLLWVRAHPVAVAVAALVSFGITAAGAYRLEIESDFTKNFRADSPIVQAYDTVETHLGGAGVWDILLPAPQSLDWDYLRRVLQLQQRLRAEVAVADGDDAAQPALKVLSLGDALVAGAPSLVRQRNPLRRAITLRAAIASVKTHLPIVAESLHATDPAAEAPAAAVAGNGLDETFESDRTGSEESYYRIMLRAVERQPAAQKRRLIQDVAEISRQEFPEAEVTGFFVLLTNLISSILRDQWLTFAVALSGIGLAMLLAFRHPLYAVAALVPNVLPILVVTGLMGWMGLRINMGAAMIAAVSLGLSVDSSIHYIIPFLRARKAGRSVAEALDEIQQSVGRAVVFSTLALIIGFTVLITSEFIPTVYFGVLVSLAMLGGLLGNLIVLPVLLTLITRRS